MVVNYIPQTQGSPVVLCLDQVFIAGGKLPEFIGLLPI